MADIVDTVMQAGSFTRLHEALEEAGLLDKVKGPGPFTLFAPDDKAFARLGDDVISLLYQNIPNLRQVLLYHILPGIHTESNLGETQEQVTLNGDTVVIRAETTGLRVNNARIVKADLEADNGIAHIMDNVVLSKVEAEL